jgi:maleate isomerase
VASASSCSLPSNQAEITPAALHGWVVANVPDTANAIVIGGNGLRAVGAIAALERDLERPVVTANQALFWDALRAAGATSAPVQCYGRLFATHTDSPAG